MSKGIVIDRGVEAAMRDGTILRGDVYRPAAGGPHPTLVLRTPYNRADPMVHTVMFDVVRAVAAGYAFVVQDTRGRYGSDGRFEPFRTEGADGHDTVEWGGRPTLVVWPDRDGRDVVQRVRPVAGRRRITPGFGFQAISETIAIVPAGLRVQPEIEIPAGIARHNKKTSVKNRRMNPPRPALSNRGTVCPNTSEEMSYRNPAASHTFTCDG